MADSQSPAASADTLSSSHNFSATFIPKFFRLDGSLCLQQPSRPCSWAYHGTGIYPSYANESSLTLKFIDPALTEILSCFDALEHMRVAESVTKQLVDEKTKSSIGRTHAFWAVRDCQTKELHPFCAIEATLPPIESTSTAEIDSNAAGQMFLHLSSLRQHYGVRAPFGFITTYFTWWICWLPDCDGVAQDSSLSTSGSFSDIPETPELHGAKFDLPNAFTYASATQQDRDAVENFCRAIASAVWKSVKCGRNEARTSLPSYSMCYLPNSVTWKSLKEVTNIIDTMPGPCNHEFFELGFLGAGSEGKASIVCSAEGQRCVMKHYHQENGAKKAAERERSFWALINGVETDIRILNNRIALLMPYLHPVSSDECNDPAIQEQVIQVLLSCADKNYIQSDAAWRHLGWYKNANQRKLMLFDFGHIKELDTHDTVMRQNKINAAVLEFCACEKRGLCKMCEYVKEHSEPPRAESKTRTSSRTTPAPSQLPTVRRTRSNTVLPPTPPQLPKSHARPRVAPKSPVQSRAAAKPSKKPLAPTATADKSAARPKYKGAN